ncbi:MAG: DUF4836 family protein [Chitinophagaceae bacterium]
MKKTMSYLGFILMALVTFSSCSSKPDAPIPADASFVMHIDGASISEKLPWSEVKESQLFKDLLQEVDGNTEAEKILNDPKEFGLDLESDGWVFLSQKGKGAYSTFIWGLKDASKFEDVLKKANPNLSINKKESIQYIQEDEIVVAWSDENLMFLVDASELTRDLNKSANASTGGTENWDGDYEEPFSLDGEALANIALELQSLKSDEKLTDNDKFADLISTDGDVHFWFNAGKFYDNTMAGNLMGLSKMGTLVEGNISAITINFTDGGIDIDSKGYMGKELEELYQKYKASNFNETALKNLPAGEVNLALAINYPPEGLKSLLTLLGVDGLLNAYIQEGGFSIDEFINANSGNIFLALSDFKINQVEKYLQSLDGEPIPYTTEEPDGKLLFGAEVNDRSAFQKMIDVSKRYLEEKMNMPATGTENIPYELKEKWFVAGNNPDQVNQFGSTKTEHAFIDRIKGHPIGLFVNIQSFIKVAATQISENKKLDKDIAALSSSFWKEIVMTGGELEDGAMVTKLRISLGDANTNSLKSLSKYIGQLSKLAKEDEIRREQEWSEMEEMQLYTDSTSIDPSY